MNHASLFSGIGGFDLASEWMGWNNIFNCEINPFCKKVLKYYWPNAEQFDDIKTTDFTKYANKIDILTGGFPCQPYSSAGKRLGKNDSRHLWPYMLRSIEQIKPNWIVGENVFGITNWNGGMVFDEICIDLENKGYKVQPVVLPAASINAPHKRNRVWFVANTNSKFVRAKTSNMGCKDETYKDMDHAIGSNGNERDVTNANVHGFNKFESTKEINTNKSRINAFSYIEQIGGDGKFNNWRKFPTESSICSRNDGFSSGLDGITILKHRKESLTGYGNAVVPQLVLQIFKTIQKLENERKMD